MFNAAGARETVRFAVEGPSVPGIHTSVHKWPILWISPLRSSTLLRYYSGLAATVEQIVNAITR